LFGFGVIAWDGDPDVNTAPADCPETIDDLNADWLVRTVFAVPAGSGPLFLAPSLDWNSESSAMRRLGNTRGLLMVAENFGISATVHFSAQYRYLLLE